MRLKKILLLLLSVAIIGCMGTVIASAEIEPGEDPSNTTDESSESSAPSDGDTSSEGEPSSDANSSHASSSVSSNVSSSSGSSSSKTSTTSSNSTATSSKSTGTSTNKKPNVGTYTDNSDTGSDLSLASGESDLSSNVSSRQTTAGNKKIDTGMLTRWVFIPIIFAALAIAGLFYVNYTAYLNKKEAAAHEDFDLSSVKSKRRKKRPGSRSGGSRNRRL